jgi:hypothetical protein
MSNQDSVLNAFNQREAAAIAQFEQFKQWSLAMIALMINEQESRLLASDLPVETDDTDQFWREI